jgi:hypothetical protein
VVCAFVEALSYSTHLYRTGRFLIGFLFSTGPLRSHVLGTSAGGTVIVRRSQRYRQPAPENMDGRRIGFAASNNDSLGRLLPLLKKQGVHQYIYVFDPREPTLPTMLKDSSTSHWWDDRAHHVWVKADYAAKLYIIH